MRARVGTGAAALGCGAALLLAGCTGADPEPATTSARATATSAPTPSPTPTGPIDRTDEELGIRFENLPDVTGDTRAALDVYTLFETEFWRSTTQGAVSDVIAAMADPAVVDVVRAQVDGNIERQLTVSGESVIRFMDVTGDSTFATITTCQDWSEALITGADGTVWTGEQLELEPLVASAQLVHDPGMPWRLTSFDETGETC